MASDKSIERIQDYLRRIRDTKEDKCWVCNKSPERIKREFFEIMQNPPEGMEGLNLDDLTIMTYKTQKPICAGCYFTMRGNVDLVKEILEKSPQEVWGFE